LQTVWEVPYLKFCSNVASEHRRALECVGGTISHTDCHIP